MSTPIAPMSRMIKSKYIVDAYSNVLHSDDSGDDLNPEILNQSQYINQAPIYSSFDQQIKNCQKKLEKVLSPVKKSNIRDQEEYRQNEDMMNHFYKMMKYNKELEAAIKMERAAHESTKRKMQNIIGIQQQEIEILKKTIFETNVSSVHSISRGEN